MPARVLIVEDDPSIAGLLALHLAHAGHDVTHVADARGAVETTARETFDLLVLDLGLPDFDGVTVCRRVRREGQCRETPLLVITARQLEADVVLALESGADAVMRKPFSVDELRWRVSSLLRRAERADGDRATSGLISTGPIVIDVVRRRVQVDGHPVSLTRQEFDLLLTFARSPGRLFTRRALALRVWGPEAAVSDRAVDIAISRLRRALGAGGADRIRTRRGLGYALEC